MAIKVHLSKVRKGPFGGTITGTLCQRLRSLSDGMNCTTDPDQVTCKFCLRLLKFTKPATEQ